jgi:hypothetical protein
MALVVKKIETLTHPTEEGAWFRVRVPLSSGDLEEMRTDGKTIGMSLDLAASVIQEWSYPEPVTLANVKLLDLDTFTWLATEIQARSGVRTDAEKKGSSASSPATSDQATEPSPANSGT